MSDRFTWVAGAVCLALFVAFYVWQSPGVLGGRLSADEIDGYLARLERQLTMPEAPKALLLSRLRAWAEADDGRPVYMLNLMRYRDALQPRTEGPQVSGTPREVNARYEAAVRPLLLALGAFPQISGPASSASLVEAVPALDRWDQVTIVRHPSRRTFLELISDPDYAAVEPLKTMALEVVLVPFEGALVLPDLRWPLGGLLIGSFLLVRWWRSAHNPGSNRFRSHVQEGSP